MSSAASHRSARSTVAALTLLAVASGCASSTYRRRDQSLLMVRSHSGMPVLERDGQIFDANPFGGGLQHAVAGNAEAVALAELSRRSMIAFLGSYLGGIVLLGAGAPIAAVAAADGGDVGDPQVITGIGLVSVGLVAIGASFYFATQGQAAQVDAVNAYNDGVITALRRQLAARDAPPPAAPSAPPGDDGGGGGADPTSPPTDTTPQSP